MSVSKEEFEEYRRSQDKKMGDIQQGMDDIKSLLLGMQVRQSTARQVPGNPVESHLQNLYRQFQGVIPHPLAGRDKSKSSFVNVPSHLQNGIAKYNAVIKDGEAKIDCTELEGSLASWSNNASNTLEAIIACQPGLADGLRKGLTLEAIQKIPLYVNKKRNFSADKAAVIREIKKAIPIVTLGRGDWPAYELLKNKLVNNARSVAKKSAPHRSKTAKANATNTDNEDIRRDDPEMQDDSETNLPESVAGKAAKLSRPSRSKTTNSVQRNTSLPQKNKTGKQFGSRKNGARKVGMNLLSKPRIQARPEESDPAQESGQDSPDEDQDVLPSFRQGRQRDDRVLQTKNQSRRAPATENSKRTLRMERGKSKLSVDRKIVKRRRPAPSSSRSLKVPAKKKAAQSQQLIEEEAPDDEQEYMSPSDRDDEDDKEMLMGESEDVEEY